MSALFRRLLARSAATAAAITITLAITSAPMNAQSSSGSSSVDAALRANSRTFRAYLVFLILVGAGTLYFTFKVKESDNLVQDAIRSDGEAKTAAAQQEAGRANESAGKANENAGLANERAANIEVEAAALRERAAVAERELLEIKERIKPRHLSADERARIVAASQSNTARGPVRVECPTGQDTAYAEEIVAALNAGGWTEATFTVAALVRVQPGLLLAQHAEGNALPHVQALYRVFTAAGIPINVGFNERVPEGAAVLTVGPKP